MDRKDEMILKLMRGNARISFQELGDKVGISRVAAMKRVRKLEEEGIIRGYNTYICRDDMYTLLIDIVTVPGKYDEVLDYIGLHTTFIRQIFGTTKENHMHIVAVSDSVQDLKYLVKMIQTKCGENIEHISSHAVKEVIKDVYGGIRYVKRSGPNDEGDNKRRTRHDN